MQHSKVPKSFDWNILHQMRQQGVITQVTDMYCALAFDRDKALPEAWQCTITVQVDAQVEPLTETASGDTKDQAKYEASYRMIDNLRAKEKTLAVLAECKAWKEGRDHGGAHRWVVGDEYPHDEDRIREFKVNQMDNNSWKDLTSKNVSAFLNSEGGSLFFGINDDGIITGIEADRAKRDKVKLHFDSIIKAFQPAVDPKFYKFVPHPAHAPEDPEKEMCVVEIQVHSGAEDDIYFTGGSSSQAFIRRDGSTHVMDAVLIKDCHTRRLHKENARLRDAISRMTMIGNGALS